jgi:protein-L-isoaspartate O-methyltransferase
MGSSTRSCGKSRTDDDVTPLDYEHARHRMVDAHIARRAVRDECVLAALRKVARETFVDAGFEEFAYEDSPLPIGMRISMNRDSDFGKSRTSISLSRGQRARSSSASLVAVMGD